MCVCVCVFWGLNDIGGLAASKMSLGRSSILYIYNSKFIDGINNSWAANEPKVSRLCLISLLRYICILLYIANITSFAKNTAK